MLNKVPTTSTRCSKGQYPQVRTLKKLKSRISNLLGCVKLKDRLLYDTVVLRNFPQENGTYAQITTVKKPKFQIPRGVFVKPDVSETITDFDKNGKPIFEKIMTRFGWESYYISANGEKVDRNYFKYKTPLRYFDGDGYFM